MNAELIDRKINYVHYSLYIVGTLLSTRIVYVVQFTPYTVHWISYSTRCTLNPIRITCEVCLRRYLRWRSWYPLNLTRNPSLNSRSQLLTEYVIIYYNVYIIFMVYRVIFSIVYLSCFQHIAIMNIKIFWILNNIFTIIATVKFDIYIYWV